MSRTSRSIEIGAAEADFTPAPGLQLLGQMHERIAGYARDPLMASAIAFRQGRETAVLVSVDIAMLNDPFVKDTQKAFARRTGVRGEKLLLHSTHTHVAPTVFTLLTAAADPGFVANVREAIVGAAERALANLEPSGVFSGTGFVEHMGWNRRAMFSDGSSRMYAHSECPGFIGMEGPRDGSVGVLCARDRKDKVRAIVVNFATHPNCLEGDLFYSADIPGATRRVLKQLFGDDVIVVYLTGAAGNTAPSILDPYHRSQPWRGEAGVLRSGQLLGGEAAKVIASAISADSSPQLRLVQTTARIPIRPWPKRTERTYPISLLDKKGWPSSHPYYAAAQRGWRKRLATVNPWPVRLSVIRLGDTAICTNPAELFVEFGLEIRKQSPARVTIISELTDGYCGYVPTELAFSRGGYETWPAPSSQLAVEAGSRIVAVTQQLLQRGFKT
jgi:neutral ceramidase